jgi:hypothetical protein
MHSTFVNINNLAKEAEKHIIDINKDLRALEETTSGRRGDDMAEVIKLIKRSMETLHASYMTIRKCVDEVLGLMVEATASDANIAEAEEKVKRSRYAKK